MSNTSTNGVSTTISTDGVIIDTEVTLSHSWLDEKIAEYVRDARENGYPETPTIGVEYLLTHMDTDRFGDLLDDFIQEQITEYISDAIYDAEITLKGN